MNRNGIILATVGAKAHKAAKTPKVTERVLDFATRNYIDVDTAQDILNDDLPY